jgi:hypothetical protein
MTLEEKVDLYYRLADEYGLTRELREAIDYVPGLHETEREMREEIERRLDTAKLLGTYGYERGEPAGSSFHTSEYDRTPGNLPSAAELKRLAESAFGGYEGLGVQENRIPEPIDYSQLSGVDTQVYSFTSHMPEEKDFELERRMREDEQREEDRRFRENRRLHGVRPTEAELDEIAEKMFNEPTRETDALKGY